MKQFKKIFLIIICLLLFFTIAYASTTTYMSCGGIKGIPYDIPGVVRLFINFIKMFIPIILILMGSIDFAKVVIGNDDNEMKKATGKFVKRCIAAVAIFFVIYLVQLLISLIGTNTSGVIECISCFTSDSSKCSTYEVEKEELEAEREENEEEDKQQQTSSSIPPGGSKNIDNALGLPYYNQCDPRWKNIQYDIGGGKNGTPATLCSSSCGYTSLSMVVAGLTKDSTINPYTMVKFLRKINDGELTQRGYGAASRSELTSSKLTTKYGIKGTSISSSNIMSSLQAGKPVVILVPRHYMTLSISSNGKVVLLDPFTNWSNSKKGPREFNSISEITSIYGSIEWAAAYEKI